MNRSSATTGQIPARASRLTNVLVVDRDDLARGVRAGVGEAEVHVVATWLAAMGEVARRPVDVIIGPLDAMSGLIEPTAGGLRRLAPEAVLVIAADASDEAGASSALDAGFDHWLRYPIDGGELSRIIHAAGSAQAAADAHATDDAHLGDTDLAQAVMSGVQAVRDLAVRIIRARGELPEVGFCPAGEAYPEGHAAAVSRHRTLTLGTLHAPPPARREQLSPWAEWLGHWLALAEQHDQLKYLAMHDELTGAWNRRYFNRFLARVLDRAAKDRSQVTVMVFDIDNFKLYNDRYGHAAGDEILRESARLMQAVVREHDVVARIGGDEFAVIFWDAEGPRKANSAHPQDVAKAARRFQQAICAHKFPKLLDDAPGTLTISGGLASFPWDGSDPDQLLARADEMALQSKRQGKNAITFGPGALRDNEAACGDGA